MISRNADMLKENTLQPMKADSVVRAKLSSSVDSSLNGAAYGGLVGRPPPSSQKDTSGFLAGPGQRKGPDPAAPGSGWKAYGY
ncbi:MAG: hypothetical protein ACTFAL_00225 [Candidatus Electronema sp. V4]|uniref:hypothetical protein n=1 Tax=Candidatus Electronema sp. V4 TaxID=3454756 RepID=UPI00405566EB